MNIRQSAPGDRTLAVGDLGAPDTGPGAQGARAAGGQATLPEAGMAAADVDVANLPRGAIIGRYMVLNRLGAGGMGVVYAAYDPELDRKVAIKLLLGGPGSFGGTQGRARLMREAQAMARVSHPNVISVFDIGTAFGQVFVAMEFVDGGTLTEWLKGKRTQDEILHMFILAGRGLLAAHAAGLVHRDFKPDNVLIGSDGRVRVTDFGIVRSMDQPETAPATPAAPAVAAAGALAAIPGLPAEVALAASQPLSLPLTQAGALLGTPRYMAPEQFMNRATDQRTDEFSFCVALYDAVYGAPPFAGNSVGELLYNVVQGQIQPPPANRRVPAWLRKALLRGLSTEPGARYPNMVSLLADLSLDRRRARQRWLGALAGALALASLIGLAVFWQRARTRLAERRCSQAGAALDRVWGKARQQAAHDALKRSGASFAEDTWQRIMRNVDRYLEGWQTVRDRQCHASYSEHQLKPILLQRSLRCLDQKLASVGAFAQVLSKADESAITQAAEVSGSFPELDECEDRLLLALLAPEKPEQQAPLDDFNQKLEEARLLGELGRYVEQRELAKKTLAMARRIGYPPAIADALALLALSESSNGDYASADRDYFAAAVTSIEGGDHQQTVEHFLSLMSLLGTKLAQKDQALRYEQLAAAELRTVVSSERIKLALQRRMALIACQVHFTAEPRRLDLAESECKHALALQAKLYPAGHRMDFSILNNLAIVYKRQDRFAEALGLYQQVLGYYEKSRGPQHPSVATEIYNIGRIFEAEDKFAEAKQYYDRSLQLRSRGLGPEHPQLLATIGSLVDVALRQADYPAALSYAERYRKIKLREAGKDDNAKMAPAHGLLGRVLYKQGRFDDALKEHQRAVELCQRHRCEYASYMVAEADDWRALGKNKQAVPLLEQALKLEQGASVAPLYLARNQFSLAQALWATDKKRSRARILMLLDSAQELYQKAGRTSHFELEEITAWRAKNPVAAANPPKRSLSRDR